MALDKLSFTKNWTNSNDFPTVETDEAAVRRDMQLLHDETKSYINEKVVPAVDAVRKELDEAVEVQNQTKHTHGNKALLDTYAQTEENLADAVAKKHSHHNKDVLDGIAAVTQELGAEPDRVPSEAAVSAAIAAAGNLPAGGVAGQALVKKSDTAYDTQWDTLTAARVGAAPAEMVHLATYTELSHIGVTKGSETMVSIAQAMQNNSILEVSCGDGNNSAADGSAYPVVSGGAFRYGILRVTKIGGNDRVSFEFRVKEKNARIFTGFYSSTDGWSGWKKVYTEGSKPSLNELVDTVPINLGGTGKKTAAEALAALGGITAAQVGGIHIWRRRDAVAAPYGSEKDRIIATGLGSSSTTATIEYYNAYVQDGTIQLALAGSVALSYNNILTAGVVLRGHWVKGTNGTLYYAETDAALSREKASSSNYKLYIEGREVEVSASDVVTALSSASDSAYPKNVYSGAYYYEYLGTVGGAHVRFAAGSYAGDGECGADKPNRLTFDFVPQVIFLYCQAYTGSSTAEQSTLSRTAIGIRGSDIRAFAHYGSVGSSGGSIGESVTLYTTWGGNYIEWYRYYSSGDEIPYREEQMNRGNYNYGYIVLGW